MNSLLSVFNPALHCITFLSPFSVLAASGLTASGFTLTHVFGMAFPPTLVTVAIFVPAVFICMVHFPAPAALVTFVGTYCMHFK